MLANFTRTWMANLNLIIDRQFLLNIQGPAMAQAVSRWLLTAEALVLALWWT
jgi:hypothetical protein